MAISDEEISAEAVRNSLTLDIGNPDSYIDLQIKGYQYTGSQHFDETNI